MMQTSAMKEWAAWLRTTWFPSLSINGIDMGDGRILGAEDVLESHFMRLARRPRTENVPVQVGDNLVAAITVLAPKLAPLTEVAEEVAQAMPPVQPAPQFRKNLHQALERTHRQHAAQRVLGTRNRPKPSPAWRQPGGWVLVASLLLTLLAVWWYQSSKREESVTAA
jgi:hypothetical protein